MHYLRPWLVSLRLSSRNSSWIFLLIGLLFGSLFTLCLLALLGSQPYKLARLRSSRDIERSRDAERYLSGTEDEDYEEEEKHEHAMPVVHHTHAEDQTELHNLMYNNVRVLCWIMTAKKNTLAHAVHINATWAPRCNKYIFFSVNTSLGLDLPNVELNMEEGRDLLWQKTKLAFKHVYDHYLNDYDWFLKEAIFFGCKYKVIVKEGYMSGGAGYVVSREGLRRFVEESMPDPTKCKQELTGAEDAEFGKCAAAVGIVAGDSRDRFVSAKLESYLKQGRHRMLPFGVGSHTQPGDNKTLPYWFYNNIADPYKQGDDCCSDYMVSFHYVDKPGLYSIDYLLYHVRPFALGIRNPPPPGLTGDGLLQYAKEMAIYYQAPPKTAEEKQW